MKYCPYCGASIADRAASFCPRCAKKLTIAPQKPAPRRKKIRPAAKKSAKNKNLARDATPEFCDEGYDGYYDDVLPEDNGHTKDRIDPAIIRNAALIAAGAFSIIILSVFLMYLL